MNARPQIELWPIRVSGCFQNGEPIDVTSPLTIELCMVSKHLQDAPLSLKLPHWIAQSTAAELLQVNVAFFSRLAKTRPGLLPQRRLGYTPYLASDVQALVAKYIFVPEIARRADMHPRRVVSWLRSERVAPCLSLQENRDFGYLLHRSCRRPESE